MTLPSSILSLWSACWDPAWRERELCPAGGLAGKPQLTPLSSAPRS